MSNGTSTLYGNRWINLNNIGLVFFIAWGIYWIYYYPIGREHAYQVNIELARYMHQAPPPSQYWYQLLIRVGWVVISFMHVYRIGKTNWYFVVDNDSITVKNYLRINATKQYRFAEIEAIKIDEDVLYLTLKNSVQKVYKSDIFNTGEWPSMAADLNDKGLSVNCGKVF